jgi:hypothetical protein
VNAGSAVSDKVFSETVWKIAGRLLDPGFGYTTAVIKIVDPEKMRTFIKGLIQLMWATSQSSLSKAGESLIRLWMQLASVG